MAKAFLQKYSSENHKRITGFTQKALLAIEAHDWPGNVRELENRIKRAVVMAEGSKVTSEDLELITPSANYESRGLKSAREALERDFIGRALSRNEWNITKAAAELGISRPTMYELMEKLGFEKGGRSMEKKSKEIMGPP